MVVIDTDVVLLAFAFQNDRRQPINTAFLKRVQTADPAITVYNLMELLGQLSFNLSPARLEAWQSWLIEAHRLTVIWPLEPNELGAISFRAEIFDRPYARMKMHRMAFMDALVLNLAERTPGVEQFVTWNARHFKEKSTLTTLTPEEYLDHIA
jgi:hypothetical protein